MSLGLAWFLLCAGARAETIYFNEDFERPDAPAFTVWYRGEGAVTQSVVTEARTFAGKRSAYVESPTIAYFEIPLPKPLKWDRHAPDGIGTQPLYLSARVFAEDAGIPHTDTLLGFQASIVPKHRPTSTGSPIHGGTSANVARRTNEWLWLVFDVAQHFRELEARGDFNPDQIVFTSVSLISYSGGKYYMDDIRLAPTPPAGWTPPPPVKPAVDAAAYFRRDPRLEAMILHGCYGGFGSVFGDTQLHPWVMRDMKRHYLNFVGPSFDMRFTAPARQLQEFDLILEQAKRFAMPVIPMSYIGSRYAPRATTDEELQAAMLKIVHRYRDNPWLLAWYLEEEPGPDRAAQYLKEKRWVDEADPNHNCLMIFNAHEGLEAIGPAQSVVMRDIYTISGPNPNPWSVPRQVAAHVRQFPQPFVLTTQIFGGDCCWTPPTVGQFRLMTYGALAEGAKGFCHFAYSTRPFHQQRVEHPMYGTMVDPYGAPSPVYDDIARQLGPDLFRIGELLRTCRPADMLADVTMNCGTIEDALEYQLPTIAVRRLVDEQNHYEILALYSNDPDHSQTGVLQVPAGWELLDLSAHSRDIIRRAPIFARGPRIKLRLAPGDGQFYAIVDRAHARQLLERMQRRRLEAVRKMVEFDNTWLVKVGLRRHSSTLPTFHSPAAGLAGWLKLDRQNQARIARSPLAIVLRQLEAARNDLSAANQTIGQWAKYKAGQPFPPDLEPGKSWCDAQDKLGELFVGFSDLAYRQQPATLVSSVATLAALCRQHADELEEVSAAGIPTKPGRVPAAALDELESQLRPLGWPRPPTAAELLEMNQ